MYSSFALGAHGAIAAILSAVPHASVDLWNAVNVRGDRFKARDLHAKMLRLWNAMFADNLPACTKYAQELQGVPAGLPRAPMPVPTNEQKTAIRQCLEALEVKFVA
jgi:4-hydroxy-tetrahydrodipicolinate synthase